MGIFVNEDYPTKLSEGGTYTFAGVLREYCNEIAKDWNDDTQKLYESIYNSKLLPKIGKIRPIASLTAENYREILREIEHEGKADGKPYDVDTMKRFERLLRIVHETAADHQLCASLWEESFDAAPVDNLNYKIQLVPKSFSIDMELRIAAKLLEDPTHMNGQLVGLLVMLFTGVRNNEAAGLNFGDLKKLDEFPDTYTLRVYQTTKPGSSTLKAGGKTRNAVRIIPIPNLLRDVLLERRKFVESMEAAAVDGLPIACKNNDYTARCSSADLTVAGRELLKQVGMKDEDVTLLDQYLRTESAIFDGEVEEKSPTTYLFRRNAATHYKNLGLSLAKIQYLMGHDIDASNETRSSFANPQKLQEMKRLIDNHPLAQNRDPARPPITAQCVQEIVECGTGESGFLMSVDSCEPNNKVRIRITDCEGRNIETTVTQHTIEAACSEEVVIQDTINRAYDRRRNNGKNGKDGIS